MVNTASEPEKSSSTKNSTSSARDELQKAIKHQIMMSIGLEYEEKGELIQKLPTLSETQLKQLKEVFEEEEKKKEEILQDLFTKNPELYPEFEKFSKDHVNSIYHDVENEELVQEEKRMEEILQVTF